MALIDTLVLGLRPSGVCSPRGARPRAGWTTAAGQKSACTCATLPRALPAAAAHATVPPCHRATVPPCHRAVVPSCCRAAVLLAVLAHAAAIGVSERQGQLRAFAR